MQSRAYVSQLVALAARTRSPLRLAVALRAQYPDWGARASFTALGLRGMLDHLGWPLDTSLADRFERFAMDLAALHPEPLWSLRREQVRHVRNAIERPRSLRLRAWRTAAGTDAALAALLVESANLGLTLADVRALVDAEHSLPRSSLTHLSDVRERDVVEHLRAWRDALLDLDVRQYVDLLERSDRDYHPDVLRAATLRDVAALGRASIPSPEQRLEASLAELADHESEADAVLAPIRSGALQA